MIYDFMRLILFFDLPVVSKEDRRIYATFRKYLIKNGYIMMQYSVYCKIFANREAAVKHVNILQRNVPQKGQIRILLVTEKQYAKIEIIVGGKSRTSREQRCIYKIMNLLTIKNGTNKWNLQMNHVKYIISDSSMNYTLLQAIRLFTSKDKSENRTENNTSTKMFINEKEIEFKNNMFIEISEMYSLNEDKKLTTKSLMLKYLEIKLQNQDYFDTISTIDILLNSLSEEVNDESMLKIMFNGANYKQLIKMLSPYYEDELQKDEFDLTRDELILLQLDLVEYISNHNSKYDNIFVFGKLDNLSDKILQKINKIENVKLIIFTNYYNDLMNVQNAALLQDKIIDFADMEQIYYDLSQKSLQTYTLQEVEQMTINYLQQTYTQETHDIYQELEHFSIK